MKAEVETGDAHIGTEGEFHYPIVDVISGDDAFLAPWDDQDS
ncbi:hypothetical protein [Streptomyces sp. NPDC055036]